MWKNKMGSVTDEGGDDPRFCTSQTDERKERTLTHIKYRVGKRLLRDVRAAMKRNNLACCISQTSMV